jgi:hypothetical protein
MTNVQSFGKKSSVQDPAKRENSSSSFSPVALGEGFRIIEEELHITRPWQTSNSGQEKVVALNREYADAVRKLKNAGYIKAKSAWEAAIVNEWFKQNHQDIELQQQPLPSIYVGTIFEMLTVWQYPGEEGEMTAFDGHNYPAASFESGVKFWQTDYSSDGLAAELEVEGGKERFFLLPTPQRPVDLFALWSRAADFVRGTRKSVYDFNALQVPMVNLQDKPDISWLVGMRNITTGGTGVFIAEAKMVNIFKFNHLAALAQSTVALSASLEALSMPEFYRLDQPYMAIFTTTDLIPTFTVWCDPEVWRNPGDFLKDRK